jgi:hypothetical protein
MGMRMKMRLSGHSVGESLLSLFVFEVRVEW